MEEMYSRPVLSTQCTHSTSHSMARTQKTGPSPKELALKRGAGKMLALALVVWLSGLSVSLRTKVLLV